MARLMHVLVRVDSIDAMKQSMTVYDSCDMKTPTICAFVTFRCSYEVQYHSK